MKLLAGVLGVSVMLAANAAVAAAKKQKPVAPQAANSSLCRGANLYQCGPLYNSTDYLGTDPDSFIRAMIQRDLGPKYRCPELGVPRRHGLPPLLASPPSIVTMVPLVYDDRSEARNTTVAAISSV